MFLDIWKDAYEFVWKLLFDIVGFIYNIIGIIYQIFVDLSKFELINEGLVDNLLNNIYTIIGVVVLFLIAYNILMFVIDPEKNKGGKEIEKLIKKLITSFIIIFLTPTCFAFAINLQRAIINDDIIGSIINGNVDTGYTYDNAGRKMAVTTFHTFFSKGDNASDANLDEMTNMGTSGTYKLSDNTEINCADDNNASCTLGNLKIVAEELNKFSPYKAFAANIVENNLSYNWLIAIAAGVYLAYVIINYCFDMALRACKLAFYQVIAPIAAACRIAPNSEKIFQNWFKATKNTYLSVFIRIIIMNLSVFLLNNLSLAFADALGENNLLVNVFLIMGIVTFIKQAPKLIEEVFGIGGDIKLGIRDHLKEGGGFVAGAALGAGISAAKNNIKNVAGRYGKIHANDKWNSKQKASAYAAATMRGLKNTVLGTVTGARNGIKANDFRSMSSAINNAVSADNTEIAISNKKLDRYWANGKNAVTGYASDKYDELKEWLFDSEGEYKRRKQDLSSAKSALDAAESAAGKIVDKNLSSETFIKGIIDSFGGIKKLTAEFKGDEELVKLMQKEVEDHQDKSLSWYETAYETLKSQDVDLSAVKKPNYKVLEAQYTSYDANGNAVLDTQAYYDAVKKADDEYDKACQNLIDEHNKKLEVYKNICTQYKKVATEQLEYIAEENSENTIKSLGIKAEDLNETREMVETAKSKIVTTYSGAKVTLDVDGVKVEQTAKDGLKAAAKIVKNEQAVVADIGTKTAAVRENRAARKMEDAEKKK